MDLNEMGKFIAKKRKQKNMTQEQLANCLNVHVTTVSKWERAICSPDISLLPLLTKVLGVTIDDLIYARDEKANKDFINDNLYCIKDDNLVSIKVSFEYLFDGEIKTIDLKIK